MEKRPRATVLSAATPEDMIRDAYTKSIQGDRKELIIVYTIIGFESGTTIRVKIVSSDAPSIFAASRKETEIVSKKPFTIM